MRLSYFAIALILTAMGCSSVLGLDEFHEASESNAGASGSGGSGATTSDAAGGSSNAAGAAGGTAGTGSGATAGASGSGGTANSWPNEVKCAQGYKPWLQANFDRIDGAALGPTDLPGALSNEAGSHNHFRRESTDRR
ncbi:MAG: hypothetical protein R3B07_32650 [Polyangiaceae bacterium]